MKHLPTDQTFLDHLLTLSMEKKNTKWNVYSTTDVMDVIKPSNTLSNGRATLKAITHGNQLTRSMLQTF
jgi:hypothetical protein